MYIQNDGFADTNHVEVSHYDALSLTGSFTIEGWMQPVTYVASNGGWSQRQPSIVRKGIGNVNANNNNYQVAFSGWNHNLLGMVKYGGGEWSDWTGVASPIGSVEIYNWYHFAMIRDTASATITVLIYDVEGNLLSANTVDDVFYDLGRELETNTNPLWIASNPNWNDAEGFYNGYIDELRISNIVRTYAIPLGITDVIGENVQPGASPRILVTVKAVSGNEVSRSPMLHYSTDNGLSFQPYPCRQRVKKMSTVLIYSQGLLEKKYYIISM